MGNDEIHPRITSPTGEPFFWAGRWGGGEGYICLTPAWVKVVSVSICVGRNFNEGYFKRSNFKSVVDNSCY